MTPEEKSAARRQKMAKIEREFYKLVDLTLTANKVDVSEDAVDVISKYWMLKRKAGGNKPLLPPRGDDEVSSIRGEDTERDRMKQLVNIRQDLERVRNLAYMVSRREKLSRSYVKLREQTLEKQLALLADEDPQNQMSLIEMSAVLEANHGPTVYDKTFSNPDSEQHSVEDFEMLICRIAGEISEGSAQIRKDNPFRKKSTDLPSNSRTVPYERIFSDTSQSESESDSFMKISSSHQSSLLKKKKKKEADKLSPAKNKLLSKPVTRSDSSMSSSEEELALKNLGGSPHKNKSSIAKKNNIYSDSESEHEKTPRGRGRPPKKQKLKDPKKNVKKTESEAVDSEDTQNSLDIKPSSSFRTKAAMKAFNYEDLALAKKVMEERKDAVKQDDSDDSLMDIDDNNAFLLVSQRAAARKAEQKFSKPGKGNPADAKKKGSKSAASDLFGDSDDDSSLSRIADNIKHKTKNWDLDSELRKSPRRSGDHKKKHTSTDSESSDDEHKLPSSHSKHKNLSPSKREKNLSDKHLSSKSPKKSSKKKPKDSSDEDMFDKKKESHQQLDFDDLFAGEKLSGSDSEPEGGKKKLFDDFEHPEVFSDFVPQRRAAKKASSQLSEQNLWKKNQQELALAELAKQQQQKDATSAGKKKGKKEKKESIAQASFSDDSDVPTKRKTRSSSSSSGSSSSSESEDDRRKSPRGRGRSPKGAGLKTKPSKDLKPPTKKAVGPRKPRKKGADGEGEVRSSKALEYLMQRESQLSNILGDYKQESEPPPQSTPDKKLKTSEGRAEGVQSPPKSRKDSSDSDSDSSSNDSIILGIKARQQQKDVEKSDDQPQASASGESLDATSRVSRSATKEDHRGPGSRSRDSNDLSVEPGVRAGARADHHRSPLPGGRSSSAASEQLKQPGAASEASPGQKKSIFSPDRSPRTSSDPSRGRASSGPGREHDPAREKEMPGNWKSPRDWKWAEAGLGVSPKDKAGRDRELPPASLSPAKSPALNRSFEGSRSSPLQQQHRSPGFGRSPARHSQHPLNKSLDLNKSAESSSKPSDFPENKNKKADDSTNDRDSNRKFSVESKDSDVDSAKSSLPDATMNGLPDFSKEDSTDTLYSGDKLGDKPKSDPAPTMNKKDEGYVSAEKDQNDNAQDNVSKQRDGLNTALLTDKISPHKGIKRLSTEEPVSTQDPAKQASWPEFFAQQQMLEEQKNRQQQQQQQQKHDLSNSFDALTKEKNAADQFAAQQQYEALLNLNQMFNNQQRGKSGGHDLSQQQQMAYMQQYMKVRLKDKIGAFIAKY